MPGTPEAMFAEIVALRKKYDDLVAFTVKLTTERDSLSSDLLLIKKQLDDAGDRNEYDPGSKPDAQLGDKQVFHMTHVFLVAFVSFFMGHIVSNVLTAPR